MNLLTASSKILVPSRYLKNPVTTWVLSSDKDIFNKGLNPRSEVLVNQTFPIKKLQLEGECVVTPNVTFIQIMGRNNNNEGKPIFVLDSHQGIIHARIRDFKSEGMVRHQMLKLPSLVKFLITYSPELIVVSVNGHEKRFQGRWRWNNNSQLRIVYGTYLTSSAGAWPKKTVYSKLLLK